MATYVTGWTYDAWNRVRTMTYPDGELLTYEYNPGGLLKTINGVKDGQQYAYVLDINYDKFERRTSIRYGNNVVTEYTYNDLSFNLSNLKVVNTYDGNRCLMDNAYTYDAVDNVTKVTNTAPIPSTGIGGNITHNYAYDGLYRLQTANGFYQGNAGKIAAYNLVMTYDNLHNITGKKLDMGQCNMQFTGDLETGYDLTYAYNSTNDQQLTQVADTGYRSLGSATPPTGRLHRYSYDASGNLTQVLTTRTEPIPRSLPQAPAATREVMLTNRRLLWDEENRLTAVSDNGFVSTYLYDASGERTVKLTGDGEGMTVNGRLSGGRTSTDGFTAYVNPYVVVSNGSRLSKHIYAGSQRIVSKLCASGSSPSNPLILAKAAESVVNYTAKYAALKASVAARFDSLGLPFLGTDHAGSGFWTPSAPTIEDDQYFYHPDHLGSSSLITTLGGSLAQHLEYLPFGEVLVDERATPTTRSTPYKFNAKELDEETGLYYYSARYMDPRLSLWLSVDPLAEKYPGVGSYVYCYNNPVKFVDPDGREVLIFLDKNKEEDKTIIQGANNYPDDGAIHLFAHGSSKGISVVVDGKIKLIRNPKRLDEFLSSNSSIWKEKKRGDNVTLILHSCRTGEGDDSFAQNVSKDLDVKVVAPDQRVYFSSEGEVGAYKAKFVDDNNEYKRDLNNQIKSSERTNELGNWRVFENGEQTDSYKGNWKPKEKPGFVDNILYKE